MMWKLIAIIKGWHCAQDYDSVPNIIVVFHPNKEIHFTGDDAWRKAALQRG